MIYLNLHYSLSSTTLLSHCEQAEACLLYTDCRADRVSPGNPLTCGCKDDTKGGIIETPSRFQCSLIATRQCWCDPNGTCQYGLRMIPPTASPTSLSPTLIPTVCKSLVLSAATICSTAPIHMRYFSYCSLCSF